MTKNIPYIFENAVIYNPLKKTKEKNVGETRIRAFYKGKNRNFSFITDEFAEYLIRSAARCPIVGFYNHMDKDFEGHTTPALAKGYGYIPDDCNFAWEKHLDEDGVEREYACFDAILFVDYWDEASQIVGKSQSMELNKDFIEGDWTTIDGEEYYVYTAGKMKGFCVLGDVKEPCFDGATFFSTQTNFEKLASALNDLMEKMEKEREEEMTFNLECLQHKNYEKIFNALNHNYNEENNFLVDEIVVDISESEFSTYACGDKKVKKYSYSLDEEEKFSFEEMEVPCYEQLYDEAVRDFSEKENDFNNKISDYEQKISNYETTVNDLNTKISTYEKQLNAYQQAQKDQLVSDYKKILPKEDFDKIVNASNDLSYEDLESQFAIAFSRNSLKDIQPKREPKVEQEDSDVKKRISKYKK